MNHCTCCNESANALQTLKIDQIGLWAQNEWRARYPEQPFLTLWGVDSCLHQGILSRLKEKFPLPQGFVLSGWQREEAPAALHIRDYAYSGDLTHQSGAFIYTFNNVQTSQIVEILIVAAYFTNEISGYITSLICMPESFRSVWIAFANECARLDGVLEATDEVIIIGGRSAAFAPTVAWDDVILPYNLKNDLLSDVKAFYSKGVDVYRRLKLKPFRKLMLAGVPGTGKTMLCSALAKWALEQQFLAIYISSADRNEAAFWKIERALTIAAASNLPSLILLEEMDAYLQKKEERSLVLNTLDGSEAAHNERGTLLIATTNRPEAIDERVLKRPGRMDRIFIIPETRSHDDAEKMLRQYLGDMWQADHNEVAERLVGYPGAFIREVAIYALTQVAYQDLSELSPDLLHDSLDRLRDQIDARDDFLMKKGKLGLLNGVAAL